MRHLKKTCKLGRTGAHKRCMIANMLKSLIIKGRIETTLAKAKELRRHADKMVTIAKKENILAAKRQAAAYMMIRHNPLTAKEKKQVKNNNFSSYNDDRKVLGQLFGELANRYKERSGGYTRIIKKDFRVGDAAPICVIEYVE